MARWFLFLLILCPFSLFSIQWPMGKPELIHGFGKIEDEVVENGICLKGENDRVGAYNDGELIFMADEGYGPPGSEGMVVLQHDGGFRSCYSGIIPENNLENRSYLKEGDQLGTAPQGLEFAVRDSTLNQWVNPFFMFSVENDRIKPVVEEVLLEKNGQVFSLADTTSLAAGSYHLLLKISDRMDNSGVDFFPHSVKIRYLGQVHFSLSLDSLVSRDGQIYFVGNDRRPADSFFTEEGYLDGGEIVINQGRGLIEVELSDYQSNRTLRSFALNRN